MGGGDPCGCPGGVCTEQHWACSLECRGWDPCGRPGGVCTRLPSLHNVSGREPHSTPGQPQGSPLRITTSPALTMIPELPGESSVVIVRAGVDGMWGWDPCGRPRALESRYLPSKAVTADFVRSDKYKD